MSGQVIILFGPPGSGKGTQGALLAGLLQVPVISTGEILRAESESGTRLGDTVKDSICAGKLITDDLINQVVAERIMHQDCKDGFLLDGYPRTVSQAEYLDRLLDKLKMPRPMVVRIDVSMQVLEERLTGRRQCCFCGRIYNVHVHASAREGFCDEDGMPLLRRADDDESVIRERLKYYERDSLPVLEYYRDADLHRIDGNSTPGLVLEALEEALDHAGAVSRSVVA